MTKILWENRPPTDEELAARHEADHQAAIQAREAAVKAALMDSEPFRQFLAGAVTLTAYRDAAAKITAEVEASFLLPEV